MTQDRHLLLISQKRILIKINCLTLTVSKPDQSMLEVTTSVCDRVSWITERRCICHFQECISAEVKEPNTNFTQQ